MLIQLIEKGGPVMWPLLLLSLVSLAFIFERLIFWMIEGRWKDDVLLDEVMRRAESGRFSEAQTAASGSKDFRTRVLACGLAYRDRSLSQALERQGLIEIGRMRKNLRVLETAFTIAPLLGILGTIIGIIQSFNLMGAGGVPEPAAVTTGIAQALITTACGLVIALYTVIPYNIFASKCESARCEIEKYASDLEIYFRKHTPKDGKVEVTPDHPENIGVDGRDR